MSMIIILSSKYKTIEKNEYYFGSIYQIQDNYTTLMNKIEYEWRCDVSNRLEEEKKNTPIFPWNIKIGILRMRNDQNGKKINACTI